jgi:hypothetical protein
MVGVFAGDDGTVSGGVYVTVAVIEAPFRAYVGVPNTPPALLHGAVQGTPPAASVQLTVLLFPVSPPILAVNVVAALPVNADPSLLVFGMSELGVPVGLNAKLTEPTFVASAFETARIIGRSYGGLGTVAGAVYVNGILVKGIPIVPVVVVPDVCGPVTSAPQIFALLTIGQV